MRNYEVMLILKPHLTDEAVNSFVEEVKSRYSDFNFEKVDIWGKRKLAYPIQKLNEGIYLLFYFSAEPAEIKPFEKYLNIHEDVMRFMTIKLEPRKKSRFRRNNKSAKSAEMSVKTETKEENVEEKTEVVEENNEV